MWQPGWERGLGENVKVSQSCPTLWDPRDYTVHGILQARILEWVAFPFSSGSSQPRNQTGVSCIAGRFFTELSGKPRYWAESLHCSPETIAALLIGLPFRSIPFSSVQFHSVQFRSVTQLCPTLCDPMNRSTPGLPVHHQLPEFTQTHVHRVGDAIQPSHPLSSPSPPSPNPCQHQGLFQ